jgi:hypothetical protein
LQVLDFTVKTPRTPRIEPEETEGTESTTFVILREPKRRKDLARSCQLFSELIRQVTLDGG